MSKTYLCTKKEMLENYLRNKCTLVNRINSLYKYVDGVKYVRDEHLTDNTVLCFKDNDTKISESMYKEVKNAREIEKYVQAYKNKESNAMFFVEYFSDNTDVTLVKVLRPEEWDIEPIKGLIDVTDNEAFSDKYIAENIENIATKPVIVVEGTDLTGKTTLVKELIKRGYACMDRDQYGFSNCIDINKTTEECAAKIMETYRDCNTRFVIALYASDEDTLTKRLEEREKSGEPVCEYDKQCVEYNKLYMDVMEILSKDNDFVNKFAMSDISNNSALSIAWTFDAWFKTSWFNRVYIATKFNMQDGDTLALKLRYDLRSKLLGSSDKIVNNNGFVKIPDTRALYTGPFYCEQASNGDYTSTDCNLVVKEELKAVSESDTFIVYFDENYSCGSVVELMYAVMTDKNVLIVYKEESTITYNTKSEHWFAITSAVQLSDKVEVKSVKSETEVLDIIKEYLR